MVARRGQGGLRVERCITKVTPDQRIGDVEVVGRLFQALGLSFRSWN